MLRHGNLTSLGFITFFLVFSFITGLDYHYVASMSTVNHPDTASIFFQPSVTVADLQSHSAAADAGTMGAPKIKVLIVPGHEPAFGGAEYKSVKERDIVVKIGQDLKNLFDTNSRYQVNITRDADGSWDPVFQNYFDQQQSTIVAWIKEHQQTMQSYVAAGEVKEVKSVEHNDAPTAVANRLYMINKWNDENATDIVLHLHINDNPRPNEDGPGKYSGFVIYVPDSQYSNASATQVVADAVFDRLARYFPVSDFPEEASGTVEDQDLIAVGSNNTVDGVSMLIEYGYIYEPMFSTPAIQDVVAKELAYQTYLGVQDFFGKGTDGSSPGPASASSTATLPYRWDNDLRKSPNPPAATPSADAFALQIALVNAGYYPPVGETRNDCPLTGIFGSCTQRAVNAFQNDNDITGETYFGPKTRAIFNAKFSDAATY